MNSVQTPSVEFPGMRPLSPKEQANRALAFTSISNEGKPNCEKVTWIGLFFDGTNNNMYRDAHDKSYSNVVVLYNTFRNSAENGYFRYYIPGLGTAFPEIGEMTESDNGKAMGVGGDSRVHFAMIQIYNAVHRAVNGDQLLVSPAEAKLIVTSVEKGLKTVWLLSGSKRVAYFRSLEDRLLVAIKGRRPVVKLISLSIFGFSRGSAEARAFSNWLIACCKEVGGAYTFCGIPIRFHFLGIFDTVASVGLADSSPIGSGFLDWADGTMGIPTAVERCVHLAAAHEIRQSFPLSTGRDGESYPPNCTEIIYPGAHCDVGGGYSPGDQGKARGQRSLLASQVPLVKMYLEARKSGVPLLTIDELFKAGGQKTVDDLQIDKNLALRFQEYAKWSHIGSNTVEKVISEHMRLYWRWRLQVGPKFTELTSYKAANAQDQEDLLASEGDFLGDLKFVALLRRQQALMFDFQQAAEEEVKTMLPVPVRVAEFFDQHIHDSHASFRLLGPITLDDRKVVIAKIKEKLANGKKINQMERKFLDADARSPGSYPVMHDADIADLRGMSTFASSLAVSAITDTRRESGGHVRRRRVFDKS